MERRNPSGFTVLHKAAVSESREEARSAARRRSLLSAKIVSHDGAYSWDCVIRDLNDLGARVEIPPSRIIPKSVYLVSAKRQAAFEAEVVWRKANEAGLKFHRVHELAATTDAQLQFLRNLCNELAPRTSSGL
ncbi:MAG TPA: PilZ domain-containing protein [Rhizomicrobium sp.]